MKRVIALIISVAMVASLATGLAVTSFAITPDIIKDNLYFDIIDGNNVEVYTNEAITGHLEIPATVTYSGTDYTVTSIAFQAFYGCSNLTSVNIPDSVKTIGDHAFEDCSSLESVTIENGVTSIGFQAFDACVSLESITIPNSVDIIGEKAFNGCTSLESVEIGSGVTRIREYAFANCSSLESVTVKRTTPPRLDDDEGNYPFDDCSELTIYVPAESVESYKSNWSAYADKIFAKSEDQIEESDSEESDPEVEIDFGFGPVTVKTSNKSIVLNDKKIVETEVLQSENLFVPFDLSNTPVKLDGLFLNNDVYQYISGVGKGIELETRFAKADVFKKDNIGQNPLSLHLSDVSEIAGTCATAIQKKAMNTNKVYAEVNYSFVTNGNPTDNNARIYVPVDGPAKVFYLFNAEKIGIVPCEVKDGYCEFNRYFDGSYVVCAK